MDDDENNDRSYHSDGVPPVLALFHPIVDDDVKGIVPYAFSDFETDPVFGELLRALAASHSNFTPAPSIVLYIHYRIDEIKEMRKPRHCEPRARSTQGAL